MSTYKAGDKWTPAADLIPSADYLVDSTDKQHLVVCRPSELVVQVFPRWESDKAFAFCDRLNGMTPEGLRKAKAVYESAMPAGTALRLR